MITAGIDVGIKYTKAVILKDGEVVGKAHGFSGGVGRPAAVRAVYEEALASSGIEASDVEKVISTGIGKYDVPYADEQITELITAVKAAGELATGITTVVGIGADETLVASIDGEKITEFTLNQKCAAGLGLFLESFAERFNMSLEELGSLEGPGTIRVNDGCVVFAEMDALSHINHGADVKEVAKAVIEACAWRVNSTINDIYKPTNEKAMLIGGMAMNGAFVKALQRISGVEFVIPDEAVYAGAIGAAKMAVEA